MNNKYHIFDAVHMNLQRGVNLVEASAGTGKTFAIGMLVLRALVELEIPIERILIVTFTKAATKELKLRIRAKLIEAKNLLKEKTRGGELATDATLIDWVEKITDRPAALHRLQLALYDIDRAEIFTIHGFCHRILSRQALESGQLFDVELLPNISHVYNQVSEDFWRIHIYPLEPMPGSLVTRVFTSPKKLFQSVSEVVKGAGRIEPQIGSINDILTKLDKAKEQLDLWWHSNYTTLYDRFSKGLADGNFKKIFTENFDTWFLSMGDFFTGKTAVVPVDIHLLNRRTLKGELDGRKIRGEEKKQTYLADWPLPGLALDDLLATGDAFLLTLRVLLAEQLRAEVSHRLERLGAIGFQGLILRLSEALQGDRRYFLKQALAEQFSMVLIDEFQDTDGPQWHIFSTLFGGQNHYLYLIGDPKQAIYKFRGADIYSYFQVKKSALRLLTLNKNYRSHPFLVEEINSLFGSRPNPFYFSENILDYSPTLPAREPAELDIIRKGKSLAGMVYCTLETEAGDKKGQWTSTGAAAEFRRFIVDEIIRLLSQDTPVVVQLPEQRQITAQDIAILVRSNRQAEEYRLALAEAAIPAVLGSRQSVFRTQQCKELMLLLRAIAMPNDTTRIKTAMTISWFGLTGNDLHRLWQNEEKMSRYHDRFLGYYRLWQEEGLLVMMSKLLVEEKVLLTLASTRMAERAIANIQHLLELAQKQEDDAHLGIGQTLQWLYRMMQDDRNIEDAELPLESDEEAVRIVTMHSAKGLEYPVVFCPYLWYRNDRLSMERYQLSCHDDGQEMVVDLGSDQFEIRKAEAIKEQMAEELRLLYVALTRAKIRCYAMWADIKPHGRITDSFSSAFGYLLFVDGYLTYPQQQKRFKDISDRSSLQILTASVSPSPVYQHRRQKQKLCRLPVSKRLLHTDWQISSFSTMLPLSVFDYADIPVANRKQDSYPVPIVGLPAGANFGNAIHELLECLFFADIARGDVDDALITQKCDHHGLVASSGDIRRLLEQTVMTPLIDNCQDKQDQFSLSMIPAKRCLKEVEFYFHLNRFTTDRINDILVDEPTVVPLSRRVIRGYLTGFIDLVCEFAGKYYVVDYKTNFLGESMVDYGANSLIAAMQYHNYGLQYWMYSLVLHRHLQNILLDYRYRKHFGGVMYLFLRGMSPAIPGSGVYASLPAYDKLIELNEALAGEKGDRSEL